MNEVNAAAQALANVRAVRALQACEGWAWFVAEMEQEMGKRTRRVMEEELEVVERERLIVEYRALKAALERPGSALEGAERVLDAEGGTEH